MPCYHCDRELWGAMWRVPFWSMPTQNVFTSAWISFSDWGLPPHWKPGERGKQWRERKRERGGESNPDRSFPDFQMGRPFSPATCSSERLGGLPRALPVAGIERLNERWTYKTQPKQAGSVRGPNADIFQSDNREIHVCELQLSGCGDSQRWLKVWGIRKSFPLTTHMMNWQASEESSQVQYVTHSEKTGKFTVK